MRTSWLVAVIAVWPALAAAYRPFVSNRGASPAFLADLEAPGMGLLYDAPDTALRRRDGCGTVSR